MKWTNGLLLHNSPDKFDQSKLSEELLALTNKGMQMLLFTFNETASFVCSQLHTK